jgi:hypothetical protein
MKMRVKLKNIGKIITGKTPSKKDCQLRTSLPLYPCKYHTPYYPHKRLRKRCL